MIYLIVSVFVGVARLVVVVLMGDKRKKKEK
jgi:hypothetical protein